MSATGRPTQSPGPIAIRTRASVGSTEASYAAFTRRERKLQTSWPQLCQGWDASAHFPFWNVSVPSPSHE